MAMTSGVQNQTVFGSNRDGAGAGIVGVNAEANNASSVVLLSADGTEHVLWFKNDGTLMHGTRANFATPQSAGSAV